MRAPALRPPPLLLQEKGRETVIPNRKVVHHRINRTLVSLLMLLTVACLTCFGSAYYLYTTRWDIRIVSPYSTSNAVSEVVVSDMDIDDTDFSKKYLTYLPHSGFHNQRIALENALLLSHLLRRTLLVPPILLGNKPLRYVEYNTLFRHHELSSKEGLGHCPGIPVYISLPVECLHYFETSYVPWTWLVDLSTLSAHQSLFHRPNMSQAWLHARFSITSTDVYVLRDDTPYQFRFLDTLGDSSPPTDKYQEDVYITELAAIPERLLQIGTLFGTSRLRLKNSDNIAYLEMVRRKMIFANLDLVAAADSISQSLHYSYLGVHLRSGDGKFKTAIGTTVKAIWWNILHSMLNFSLAQICDVENKILGDMSACMNSDMKHIVTVNSNAFPPNSSWPLAYKGPCRWSRHREQKYDLLNTPIYVATDLQFPETHPEMLIMRQTFPCLFFLADFKKEITPLEKLVSPYDGVGLGQFVLPFVDGLVLGKAVNVVGTEGSTFSKFVKEVLWNNYTASVLD
ncbi:O-fucosyltransferase 30 [Psilocybe cubensis]|nr:O-fucosyltransferase 30 [Psilocybe cubensis]KAH9485205.1 O-fucosyltransferase 30 [Psilocybe cubensis]